MNTYTLKKEIKKIPFLWMLVTRIKDKLIKLSRLKDVFIMMILFNIWPQQLYRFSTRKALLGKKNRFLKELKPAMPFEILKNKSDTFSKMKEINVVGIGSSFNLNDLKNISGPVFLVSFWHPLRLNKDNEIIYEHIFSKEGKFYNQNEYEKNFKDKSKKELNKDITYVSFVPKQLKLYKEAGYKILGIESYFEGQNKEICPHNEKWLTSSYSNLFNNDFSQHIAIKENFYKPPYLYSDLKGVPCKSFLPSLCALSSIAEKVNVYGWDYYLESSPEKMSYWRLFFNMYKFKPDLERTREHFEAALINFYYGYQFSKLPNFTIHGFMGKLSKHKGLINKIEKVLFN
jgi:hypothetical protein